MRVLALGGGGGMGAHACRIAAGLDEVAELNVADLDLRRAERVASALGPHVRALALDVTDAVALRQAMREADVVLNTVGPFFRFGVPIITAAIESGCSYVDICDDWEPLPAMFALDNAARDAGVTALVGMGASPGVTNLLAVLAAREQDSVEGIVTGWSLEAAPPESGPNRAPSAAIVHGIRQITGTIEVTRHGRVSRERPLRRVRIDYPGLRPRTAWTFGHPESVTLPRAFPGATSLNVAFGSRSTVAMLRAVATAVDHHLLTPRRAAWLIDRAERLMPDDFARSLRPGLLPPIFALATGTHAGRPATVGSALAQLPGTMMGEVTAIPMAVALGLLAESKPGVHSPETALDPDRFFAALAPHCLGGPDPADMVVTTRSWDAAPRAALDTAFSRAREVLAKAA